MKLMMFPRMLTSHAEGWDWLMEIHPSVGKMFLAYVLPLSLVPPLMLLYAWRTYTNAPLLDIDLNTALLIAAVFFIAELIMVPIMGKVVQSIGEIADAHPPYHDAFVLAAVVPTPLWLSSLALFVPDLIFNMAIMMLALAGSAALIFQGVERVFRLQDEGRTWLCAGAVLAAGLVGWVTMMVLAFVTWGAALSSLS